MLDIFSHAVMLFGDGKPNHEFIPTDEIRPKTTISKHLVKDPTLAEDQYKYRFEEIDSSGAIVNSWSKVFVKGKLDEALGWTEEGIKKGNYFKY